MHKASFLILILTVFLLPSCSEKQDFPLSDHYDGNHFFNPSDRTTHHFSEFIKVLYELDLQPWPDFIDNNPSLDLAKELSIDDISVTFINHASFLIQMRGLNIITDPVWSYRVSPLSWLGPKRHRKPGIDIDKLPKIDYVLISHNHYDHLDLDSLSELNKKYSPLFIAPLGHKKLLQSYNIDHVVELDWWQNWQISPDATITLTPAQHNSGRMILDKDKSLWGSYFVTAHHHHFYFAGDTAYGPHFREIKNRYGSPDIAFLPIGAYSPRWFMKLAHMNPQEAVQAHLDLNPKRSIAIHYGTFQLTEEAVDQPLKDLKIARESQSLSDIDFMTLDVGKTYLFNFKTE
jgi:L-ascorbate metabolism protein UlaG (beta-lactamase superfamily)